ncbi:MAG: hypothetical protein KC656_33355, partial [Myxococcales bacterium]|nr:hypothetical protein [Myxococcales bacterium]
MQVDGVPVVRAGATVSVLLPTARALDLTASTVSLSGLPLVHDAGSGMWTHTLTGTEGDGLRTLQAQLVDDVGNVLTVSGAAYDPPIRVAFDLTPPTLLGATLQRTPGRTLADLEGGAKVHVTDTAPDVGTPISVSLTVVTDEPLRGPVAVVSTGPGAVPWIAADPVRDTVRFTLATVASIAEGEHGFTASFTDAVGNTSDDVPLGVTLVVDRTPPAAVPPVDTPHAVVHRRQPWGTPTTEPSAWVEGTVALGTEAVSVTRLDAAGVRTAEVPLADDGRFSALELPPSSPRARIALVDAAGNAGPSVWVRDLVWTAPAGPSLSVPHRVEGHTSAERGIPQERGTTATRVLGVPQAVSRLASTSLGGMAPPVALATDPVR